MTDHKLIFTVHPRPFGKKASSEATDINSCINIFWNDITYANKETLSQTLWQDKNKIPWLFTSLEV